MVTTRVAPRTRAATAWCWSRTGRVTDYAYKPDEPKSDLVTNEVFVFDPQVVLDLLEELPEREDLGDDLLPPAGRGGRAREHRLEGYWRDLGKPDAYWAAHMDLLAAEPPFDPGDPAWPLHTKGGSAKAAVVRAGARVEDSLLSAGALVAGTVRRSVLSRGAVVEAGAEVVDSVLLEDAVVRSGARVVKAILDEGVEVTGGVQVGGDGDVAMVGHRATVRQDLPAGGRLPEVED
jgi:glucose-1-phosphate adenylyltransferase